jgi:hypothetical protein
MVDAAHADQLPRNRAGLASVVVLFGWRVGFRRFRRKPTPSVTCRPAALFAALPLPLPGFFPEHRHQACAEIKTLPATAGRVDGRARSEGAATEPPSLRFYA